MDRVVKTEFLKTRDVAERVKIAESTVRKYCLELEKQGFTFKKDGDTRLFVSTDIELFKGIDSMRKIEKASLRHAVSIVLTHRQTSGTAEQAVAPASNELVTTDITQVVAELQQLREAFIGVVKENGELKQQIQQGFADIRSDVAEFKEEVLQSRKITHASTEKTAFDRFLDLFKRKQRY